MNITKQPTLPIAPRNGANGIQKAAPVPSTTIEAQGYSVFVGTRLEAIVTAPDGSTSIFSASLEVVTPALAATYLAKMRANRRVADRQVAKYVRAMEANNWRPTNQGIAFDSDGYLIDGQHRCHAVAKSGTPAVFLVVRGLPAAAQNVLDAGRARGAGDQFNITFGTRDGKQRVAVARVIHLLRTGWMSHTEAISNDEAFDLVARYSHELDWALTTLSTRRRVAPAPVMAAWAYAYGAAPAVASWAESYSEGSGLSKGDPLLMLRELASTPEPTGGSTGRMEMALKALRALWAKVNGEPIRRLYASTEGLLGFAGMRGDDISKAWDWYRVR
jgi:hypothetical protein